jgi:hypothetical protein
MRNNLQNMQYNLGKSGCLALVALCVVIAIIIFILSTENYSNGERIGYLTKFSHKGRIYKSYEGELNLTQTGMNTSSLFEFSLDNDKDNTQLIKTLDSAANNGLKIRLNYHQTLFKNWFKNRGETSYFVNSVVILNQPEGFGNDANRAGRIVDTIYMVIDKTQLRK